MQADDDRILALLERPTESLNVELKTWFDPRTQEGVKILVRAIFAIRNRNGGFFVVGFNNTSLLPDQYNLNEAVEKLFHLDYIQGVISNYASEKFEIKVVFREVNNQLHPVVIVPEGVKTPTIVKSSLNGNGGSRLMTEGDIFSELLMRTELQVAPRFCRETFLIYWKFALKTARLISGVS